eukprot:scaffold13344_cov64-Phaeocystis_antarctica.AAC.1
MLACPGGAASRDDSRTKATSARGWRVRPLSRYHGAKPDQTGIDDEAAVAVEDLVARDQILQAADSLIGEPPPNLGVKLLLQFCLRPLTVAPIVLDGKAAPARNRAPARRGGRLGVLPLNLVHDVVDGSQSYGLASRRNGRDRRSCRHPGRALQRATRYSAVQRHDDCSHQRHTVRDTQAHAEDLQGGAAKGARAPLRPVRPGGLRRRERRGVHQRGRAQPRAQACVARRTALARRPPPRRRSRRPPGTVHHPTPTLSPIPKPYPLTPTPNPNQAPCTIACVRLVITWRARKDLGLFTEPWRLEIDDLCLQLRLGGARDAWERPVLRPRRAPRARQGQPAQPVSAATEDSKGVEEGSDSDEETMWFDAEEGVGEWFAAIAADLGQEIGHVIGQGMSQEIGQGHGGGDAGEAEEAAAAAEPLPPSPSISPSRAGEPRAAEEAEAEPAEEEEEAAPPRKPDLLPLHRAAENLRLCMRRVRVRF